MPPAEAMVAVLVMLPSDAVRAVNVTVADSPERKLLVPVHVTALPIFVQSKLAELSASETHVNPKGRASVMVIVDATGPLLRPVMVKTTLLPTLGVVVLAVFVIERSAVGAGTFSTTEAVLLEVTLSKTEVVEAIFAVLVMLP